MKKQIVSLFVIVGFASVAVAGPLSFDFKDPKGVNNAQFKLDAPLEAISGSASGITGTVTFDPANPGATTGKIVIAADSMQVPNAMMKGHMHSPMWMDVAAHKEIIELLRQRSRPYLFSNTLAPSIAGASLKVLELLTESPALRDKLEDNTKFFREEMTRRGFNILPGTHPIVPIMLGDAALATQFADAALAKGVYVIGFSFPVVPTGKARIRTQISAAHSRDDLALAVEKFTEVKRELGL